MQQYLCGRDFVLRYVGKDEPGSKPVAVSFAEGSLSNFSKADAQYMLKFFCPGCRLNLQVDLVFVLIFVVL